jgi:hypothetical protein
VTIIAYFRATLSTLQKLMKKLSIVFLTTALLGAMGSTHAATVVDLELALLFDGSASSTNFDLQLNSIQNILRNNFFEGYVAALPNRRLAIAAFQFGSDSIDPIFRPIAGWTIITNQSEADSFAALFNNTQQIGGGTPLGFAIRSTADSIFNNDIQGTSAMDIASDGRNSFPDDPIEASDYARCAGNLSDPACTPGGSNVLPGGINVINTINEGTNVPANLRNVSYGTNITGSTQNNFLYPMIDDFQTTMELKLSDEIGIGSRTTPEPGSLFALATLGVWGIARRSWRQNR